MTAMLPPTTPSLESSAPPAEKLGHFLWPAAATLVLHGAIITLLLGNWSPSAPAVASEKVLRTQLVTISVAPTPEPIPVPVPPLVIETPPTTSPPLPPPAPVVERPPEPVKPPIDHAAIARQRAIELEQREQARAEEQRRIAEQQRQEQEQKQREQQQLAAQAAQEAETQRQRVAEDRRKAEAASLSQYQPISKNPPAYPKRALDKRTEGDCTVEYTVTAQGKVHNPVVVEGGCDDPVFARPALSSAKSFRYKPRMVDGVAVAVPGVRNTFRFRLEQ
ncbi:energy transducer TonB [Halopseudomonas pelagia]|uniref:energy transducer TonB n=1 Tax=Halopseudomonas pelagia TaxID=553151 RepID=UPI0003A8C62A|nr:energy transducer TonB [Halopseudomonas pelagia]